MLPVRQLWLSIIRFSFMLFSKSLKPCDYENKVNRDLFTEETFHILNISVALAADAPILSGLMDVIYGTHKD